MGKFNNQAMWDRHQPEDRQPLTESEWESGYSEWKWDKDDATADELAEARRAYAVPVCRVSLWDERRVA